MFLPLRERAWMHYIHFPVWGRGEAGGGKRPGAALHVILL